MPDITSLLPCRRPQHCPQFTCRDLQLARYETKLFKDGSCVKKDLMSMSVRASAAMLDGMWVKAVKRAASAQKQELGEY